MTDTHTHLNLPPLSLKPQIYWQNAKAIGVTRAVIIGTEIETSKQAVKLTTVLDNTYAAVGVHPDLINPETATSPIQIDTWRSELETLATLPNVVAIGECGLDYVGLQTLPETKAKIQVNLQKKLFGMQIQLAKKLKLPISIHCRNTKKLSDESPSYLSAYHDLIDTLQHFSSDDGIVPRFILHCMSGDLAYLNCGLEMGGYISFAGNITYANAGNLRELLHATPLDRLLLETDAPFLSPKTKRGTMNETANIKETYDFVAQELNLSYESLEKTVEENVTRIFFTQA